MSKRNCLLSIVIGLGLFCVATPTHSQQINTSALTKELTILTPHEDSLSYKIGNQTIARGKLLNGLKTNLWKFYYPNGELKSKAEFNQGHLHGSYQTYYENGQEMSNSYYTNGFPSKNWTSFYKNGKPQGEIGWLQNNHPKSLTLYYENGITAIKKTFEYTDEKVIIDIHSFYENQIGFEKYSLEIELEEFKGQLYKITLDTKSHLLFSPQGALNGFYERKYNSGKTWIYCEFYNGNLLEVLEQNRPNGESINTWENNGTGKLIHFHHFSDTAAIVNYKNGLKNGSVKFFHSNNNVHKKGSFTDGLPSANWSLYSQSGKIRQKLETLDSSALWTFYGPKNKRETLYNLKKERLDGRAYKFNFFGDTSAVFHYSGGLLNGTFTKFQANSPLRSGAYINGEQTGDWITHGQFNPISHKTSFGNKAVVINSDKILQPNFSYLPKIDIPLKYNFTSEEPLSLNTDVFSYTAYQFSQLLLVTPDSDDVWGTTWLRVAVTPFGFIEELTYLKSPSARTVIDSSDLISSTDLFIPAIYCGFPISMETYLVLEHFRN